VKPAGYRFIRKPLRPWTCPLCERETIRFTMWEDGGVNAIYFHADNERCFVANQSIATILSPDSEIDFPEDLADAGLEARQEGEEQIRPAEVIPAGR
jgi:hypothetical protein